MRPTLSVIVPTIGRDTLCRTLDSLDGQADTADVEVLVVGDILDGFLPDAERQTLARGPRYRYIGHAGAAHCWGHPQRTFGQHLARGAWLWWLADDDIATVGAFAAMREAIAAQGTPGPILFRVDTWQSGPVWDRPRLAEGHVDAECLVAPNDPARLGEWGLRYAGDFDMILETARLWGGEGAIDWRPETIAIARPNAEQDWTRERAGLVTA